MPLIDGLIDPGEVIDAQHVHLDLIPMRHARQTQVLRRQFRQDLLAGEDFVTAAEYLQPGFDPGQGAGADGHWIGVVDV